MRKVLLGNERKPKIRFLFISLIICVYLGYTIGLMQSAGKLISENWFGDFVYFLFHPVPISLCAETGMWSAMGLALAVYLWIQYSTGFGKKLPGKEYGSARFEDPAVITTKMGADPAKILGQEARLSTDDRSTGLNNNLLLIGGSGAGKSFRFVKPNILRCDGSMIITDPKGELLRDTGVYLRRHGYKVKVLNLVDMKKSDCYNPIAYLRTQSDVVKLVNIIVKNTTPKNATQTDPFWEKAESLYLQSLIFYVWLSPKMKGKRNMKSVIDLMKEAKVPEKETDKSDLDRRMDELAQSEWEYKDSATGAIRRYSGKEHPAYTSYMMIRTGAVDTVRSIIISANARMGFMTNSPDLLNLLSKDNMDIPSLGMGYRGYKQKTALFCVIPDADSTYNAVAGMLYSQVFQELYYQADNYTQNGRLSLSVSFWFDEFANIALPNDFTSLLSTMRSRGISANIIIQNLAQIKEKYEKTWETITGNCDTIIYLGGNEQSTHKYISELLGKWTIEKQSSSSSKGATGSTSVTEDILGRELMTADEVRMLPNKRTIIMIRGEYPILDDKYDTLSDPSFQESTQYGPYRFDNYHCPLSVAEQPQSVAVLSKEESAYESSQPGNTLSVDLSTISASSDIEIELNLTLPDTVIQAYVATTRMDDEAEPEPAEKEEIREKTRSVPSEEPAKKEEDTIKRRGAVYCYTDKQWEVATLASLENHLTEEQILEWFRPEISAEEMDRRRQEQVQEKSGKTR